MRTARSHAHRNTKFSWGKIHKNIVPRKFGAIRYIMLKTHTLYAEGGWQLIIMLLITLMVQLFVSEGSPCGCFNICLVQFALIQKSFEFRASLEGSWDTNSVEVRILCKVGNISEYSEHSWTYLSLCWWNEHLLIIHIMHAVSHIVTWWCTCANFIRKTCRILLPKRG